VTNSVNGRQPYTIVGEVEQKSRGGMGDGGLRESSSNYLS
jgi:hypothetical protein